MLRWAQDFIYSRHLNLKRDSYGSGYAKSQLFHNFSLRFVFNSSVNKDNEIMLCHYQLGHQNCVYLTKVIH